MELPHQEGDLLKNPTLKPSGPTLEELDEKLGALRRLIDTALVALVILAGGVNAYMWRQSSILSGQLVDAKKFVDDYSQNKEPAIRGFISSLQGFARTHPDFQTILVKYMESPPVRPAVAPVPAPAPKISK